MYVDGKRAKLIRTAHFNEEVSKQYSLLGEEDKRNFFQHCEDREMTKYQIKKRVGKIFTNIQNEVSASI